jgi:hypothetical protein
MLATNVYGCHRKCIEHLFESDKKSYDILAGNFVKFRRQLLVSPTTLQLNRSYTIAIDESQFQ